MELAKPQALWSREDRARYSRGFAYPILLFAGVVALYLGSIAAIVTLRGPILFAVVPVSGILVVMLFVIGHDACHQSFTSSRRLNEWIGRVAFLPSLHAFSLWDASHNRKHHRFNNIRGMDYAWIPWSPGEYAAANLARRLKYRFYRDPGGVFFYYLFEIWAQKKIVPRRLPSGGFARVQVLDSLLIVAFVVAALVTLGLIGEALDGSPLPAILLGLVAPFVIFSMMISFAVFVHHTHYRVPWFASVAEWKAGQGALLGTVHVQFPWIFRKVILNIMEHNAHHLAPGVPLYRLEEMQMTVDESDAVKWDFTIGEYQTICARCKLFDYERGQWTDFSGVPTSEPMRPPAAGEAPKSGVFSGS